MTAAVRNLIRSIPRFKPELPRFELASAPADPISLFSEWLADAVERGVAEPTAVTLSTASAAGVPSARTLLLKDVDDSGFWFSSLSTSGKGADIAENPRAALTIYWRERGRQVRVAGAVTPGPREASERDFLSRHPFSRAQAIAARESRPMPDDAAVASLIEAATALVEHDDRFVPDTWNAYVIAPQSVEFWQATVDHDQLRLRYRRDGEAWIAERLWP